jgi:hypothetical protein
MVFVPKFVYFAGCKENVEEGEALASVERLVGPSMA